MVNNYKTINDRIKQLEKTVNSFKVSDKAWEEECDFYRWCDTEDYKKIIERLSSLEQKSAPKPRQSGSCFENGCDRFGWIPPETHADVVKKKDQRIGELEEKLNEFKIQCNAIKDMAQYILNKYGIFD